MNLLFSAVTARLMSNQGILYAEFYMKFLGLVKRVEVVVRS